MLTLILFRSTPVHAHKLKGPKYAVDRLLVYRKKDEFLGGKFVNCRVMDNSDFGFQLNPKPGTTKGYYTSPPIKAEFPFNELLASWNVDIPQGTGFAIHVRTSRDGKKWGKWLFFGRQGKTPHVSRITKDAAGFVDDDYMLLKKTARYCQYRISLYTEKIKARPKVRLFSLCYTNSRGDQKMYDKFSRPAKRLKKKDWAISIPIPFRSQGWERKDISHSVCGPTSIAMLLEYHGINRPTREICMKSLDQDYGIFGIWPRNVQVAAMYGLTGWVQRFRTWGDVKEQIALGRPVVISVKFAEGVLSNAPISRSGGHILIIRGFDEDGNPRVNDPAGKKPQTGVITYKKNELAKAWLEEGGVGYVLFKD